MKLLFLLLAMLGSWPLYAQDAPDWRDDPIPDAEISVSEPAPNEVVVVINDNALGGNHAGLFAGSLLFDPAGNYVGTRRQDKAWSGTTLEDYARFQTVDGLKIHLYRFQLSPEVFATLVERMRDAGPTPPLFCASAVQNLIAEIAPFDVIKRVGWTTPSALGRILDGLTQGEDSIGACQNLDASPC
ncbi:MAG: hypothetical protein ACYCZA_02660 [Thiobacillus sp.]